MSSPIPLRLHAAADHQLQETRTQCSALRRSCEGSTFKQLFALWAGHLKCWSCNPRPLLQQAQTLVEEVAGQGMPHQDVLFSHQWCFPGYLLSMYALSHWEWGETLEMQLETPAGPLRLEHNEIGMRLLDLQVRHCPDYAQELFLSLGVAPSTLQYTFWKRLLLMLTTPAEPRYIAPAPLPDFPCAMHLHRNPGDMAWAGSPFAEPGEKAWAQRNLILDLGSNLGLDSLFYLALGYRVVAVDADIRAIQAMNFSCAHYVRSGVLQLLHAAIADVQNRGTTTDDDTVAFCGIVPEVARRSTAESHLLGVQKRCAGNVHSVSRRTCLDLYLTFGKPVFMKVDLEGAETGCLSSLPANAVPEFLSIEVGSLQRQRLEDLMELLHARGYHRFKLVFQSIFNPPLLGFGGGSGPFGQDAVDALTGLEWRSRQVLIADLAGYNNTRRDNWWDLHAWRER